MYVERPLSSDSYCRKLSLTKTSEDPYLHDEENLFDCFDDGDALTADLHEDDLLVGIKVIVVGNGAVGKSSLIQRFCCGTFRRSYSRTIGADFLERRTVVGGRRVQLMVWDTAGQEEFATITRAYYRGAAACILAFSTTDAASLAAVRSWHDKVRMECGSIPCLLVQTKGDLSTGLSAVSREAVESVRRQLGLELMLTSALHNMNVERVFVALAEQHIAVIARDVASRPLPAADLLVSADKLRRGDTIVLSSKRKTCFKYQLTRPVCRFV